MTFADLICLLSSLSALLAVWTGRRVNNALWYYACFSLLSDLLGYINIPFFRENRHANIFMLLQFALVTPFIINQIIAVQHRKLNYIFIAIISLAFVAHSIYNNWMKANYYGGSILYGITIVLLILSFYKILTDMEVLKIEQLPFFIICAAFLIYTSGSFLILLFSKRLETDNHDYLTKLWMVHNFLNIFKNASIAYAFYLYKKSKSWTSTGT